MATMSQSKAVDAVMRVNWTSWGRMSNSARARSGRGAFKAKIVLYVARYTWGSAQGWNGEDFLAVSRRKLREHTGVNLYEVAELVDELVAERVLDRLRDKRVGQADGLRVNSVVTDWRVPWLESRLHVERPADTRETDRAVGHILRETGRAVRTQTARDGSRGELIEPREADRAADHDERAGLSTSSSYGPSVHPSEEGTDEAAQRSTSDRAAVLAALIARSTGEPLGDRLLARLSVAEGVDEGAFVAMVAAAQRPGARSAPLRVREVEQLVALADVPAVPDSLAILTQPSDTSPRCSQCGSRQGPFFGLGVGTECERCYFNPCDNSTQEVPDEDRSAANVR